MDATNNTANQEQTTNDNTSSNKSIKLTVRTARLQKDISIEDNISIKDLRVKVAELFEVGDPALAVLIFGGKILKDNEDLKTHNIQDSQTVHLVIRPKPAEAAPTSQQQQQQPQSDSQNNTASSNNTTIPTDSQTNPISLSDLQQRLQQMLISNPETIQRMMQPMMQQLTENPEMIRSMFGGMQGMQQLMEQNPQLNHVLSNPEALRESLEMVRNPAALQEVMRNYDRALNNMESTPGGYNVLRRIYTELQEPLIDAMQEQLGGNQFASAAAAFDASENEQDPNRNQQTEHQTENRDPLPNPWAQSQTNNNQRQQNPLGALGRGLPNLNDPHMRSIFEAMNNSDFMSQLNNLGGFGSGGATGTQQPSAINELQPGMNNQISGMLQNPEFVNLMSNPEAIQSFAQIQQGFERLQRIAPGLFNQMRLANPLLSQSDSTNDINPAAMAQRASQLLGALGLNRQAGNTGGSGGNQRPSDDELMRMFGSSADSLQASANAEPPEERYRAQLQQLVEMGFNNREANLRALVATFGDINEAIARLLQ